VKTPIFIAAVVLVCGLSVSIVRSQETNQLLSPRLAGLQKEKGAGNASAVETFWREVTRQGTPLIEPIKGDERTVLVTFLWAF
jgi:hypothetical protein